MERLVRDLQSEAARLGFRGVGIASPHPSAHGALFRSWLGEGYHGEMAYLARPDAVARRADLRGTMEDVGSVVVVAQDYFQPDPPGVPSDPARGVLARYARGEDYHDVLKGRLTELLSWLRREAPARGMAETVRGFPYVDTGPILERELGMRAGLGWFGKNTMLIHPRRGSYFFLGLLLLDDPSSRPPFETDHCGSCRACLDACPTGALLGRDENGAPILDARRCISYLTIELRGAIPRDLRPLVGNRIFGCDICQEVCPFARKFSRVAAEGDFAARKARGPVWDAEDVSAETSGGAGAGDDDAPRPPALIPTTDGPALVDLMRMGEDEWNAYTRGSAMRRAGYAGLRRNVAIAIGNWLAGSDVHDAEAVGELVAALSDEDPVVAEAAAWGLERIERPP